MKINRMQIKIGAAIVLVILLVVWIVQNTESIPVKFFFWEPRIPRAVWIVIAIAVGFVLGMLVGSRVYEGSPRKKIVEKTTP